MANPAVTYTFVNSTTADATQVNQNFTDIINSLTDGTKSLTIDALTAGGTASFNGDVNLGNASGDTITATGAFDSNLVANADASYGLGTSTIGWNALYLGANSNRVGILPSGSMSATWNLTLPVDAGTANYALLNGGSGVTSWGLIANANVSGSAAIAYGKLSLAGSIVGGDLASNIAISTSGAFTTTVAATARDFVATGGSTAGSTLSNLWSNYGAKLQPVSSNSSTLLIGYDGTNLTLQGATSSAAVRDMSMQPYGGDVGFGTVSPAHKIDVVGSAGLSTGTAWTNTSDERLKDIQGPYDLGLEAIKAVKLVRFNYKKDNPLNLPSDVNRIGIIAQQLQQIIPDAISTRKDGYLDFNADPLWFAAVKAIQELAVKVDSFKAQLGA